MPAELKSFKKTIGDLSIHFVSNADLLPSTKERTRKTPAVVFIHGAGSNHRNWENQYRDFVHEPDMRVIAIDLPGHGMSVWFPSSPSPHVRHYGNVLLQLLQELSLGNVWLVGHSMGGAIVQEMILQATSSASTVTTSIKGVIIIGSGAHLPVSPSLLRLLEDNPSLALEKLIKWSIYRGIAEEDPNAYQQLLDFANNLFSQANPDVALFDFKACAQFDVREQLWQVQHPVGIIVGQNDVMTPPSLSEELHELLPNTLDLVKIPKSGHLVMLERPEKVNITIKKWIIEDNE